MSKSFFFTVILLFLGAAIGQEINSQNVGSNLQLDETKYDSAPILFLGKTVDIYKRGDKYYITPQLLFDPLEIKNKVESLNTEQGTFEIDLEIFFYNNKLLHEISDHISRKEEIENPDIDFITHAFRMVFVQFPSSREDMIYSFPPISTFSKTIKITPNSEVERSETVSIRFENLREAQEFAERPSLYLQILVSVPETISSRIDFSEENFLRSNRFKDLHSSAKENKNTKVTNISSSNGFSLDIKPLKIGGGNGKSSTKVESEHHRLVSSKFIESSINTYIKENRLTIQCRHMEPNECNNLVQEFKDELKSVIHRASQNITFKLIENKKKQEYELFHEALKQPIEGASVTKGAVLKAKHDYHNELKDKKSFDYFKVFSASEENEQKSKTFNDVSWEIREGEWVPVSISLYVVSEESIREILSYTRTQEVISKVSSKQYIAIKGSPVDNLTLPVEPFDSIEDVNTFAQMKKYAENRIEKLPMLVDIAITERAGPKKVVLDHTESPFYYHDLRLAYSSVTEWKDIKCEAIPQKAGFITIYSNQARWVDGKNSYQSEHYYMHQYGNAPYVPQRIVSCLKNQNSKDRTSYCNSGGEGCRFPNGVVVVSCYLNDEWNDWNERKIASAATEEERNYRRSKEYRCSRI
ncbi:hypothetical protein [Paraglaciecola hydrolytica]|uniref:Uncharacterized protein n=1 Tax=Paraglaciecola hydrolytica TaxID=1799789 RepID=A0A148KKH7_9ALTE|nr:hypothetical protein [Paraglaciecola hydrolytica]KXI26779.1 hypothetical protein AX660_03145 [Paraglaciecola hydrolytica]